MALVSEPKILRANSRLTTATRGAFLSSRNVKSLPASKAVPAARKYPGEMLNGVARAAAADGLRSVVSSVKTFDWLQQAACNGGMLTRATAFASGIVTIESIMRFCMAGIA